MKVVEMLKFASKGIKSDDAKKLIELGYKADDIDNEQSSEQVAEVPNEQPAEVPTEQPAEVSNEPSAPDYKALYEDAQNTIAELQRENINKDFSDVSEKSDEAILADIFRDFGT